MKIMRAVAMPFSIAFASPAVARRTSSLTSAGLLVIVLAIVSLGARADVSIPDTPAGHTLQAFLTAFNSGEHDRIAAYVKEYNHKKTRMA